MLGLKQIYHITVLLTLFSITQVRSRPDVPDPVALYPLNKNYETREIDNRQTKGIKSSDVFLAPGPDGKLGGSYQFVGTAQSYIEFPNNGGLDVQHSITMLCWVYPEGKDGPLFQYDPNRPWTWGTHLWIVWGQLFVRYTKRAGYAFTDHLLNGKTLETKKWHYVGSSYDHNTGQARLWLDGKQVAEKNIGAGITLATQDKVRMGAKSYDGRCFKGRIAAMQLYNVSLTAEQINEVKNAGLADICEEQKPCNNGGECEISGDSYICKCPAGFQGPTCETDINECQTANPCQNGASCENTFGSYSCTCKPGFTGQNCETDIDDCPGVVCYNGGTCVDQVNSYRCDCQSGYIGDHCEWKKLGCYKEVRNRKTKAMGKAYARFKKYKGNIQGTVLACLKAAEKQQLQIFGIRNFIRCFTTIGSAKFDRHGVGKGCKTDGDSYGVGVKKTNFVYILKKS